MWWRTLILIADILLTAATCGAQTAVIEGGKEFAVGEKIMFDASQSDADSVAWITMDAIEYQQFDRYCCVWANKGRYSVVLVAVKTVDGTAKLATQQHVFTVGDSPEPPGPGPGPQPEPEPSPDLEGLALESYQQAKKVDRKAGEAAAVGTAFETVSSKAAGLSWTLRQMSDGIKSELSSVLNTADAKQRWGGYSAWMGGKMGGAASPEQARELLDAMAEGLKASETPSVSKSRRPTLNSLIDETFHKLQSANERIGE